MKTKAKTKISKKLLAKAKREGGVAVKRKKNKDGTYSYVVDEGSPKGRLVQFRNKKADQKRSAKRPGARLSRSGKIYYERRSNRSDTNKRKKL